LKKKRCCCKVLEFLKQSLVGAVARGRGKGKYSDKFALKLGLKGSLLLFNISFGAIMHVVLSKLKFTKGCKRNRFEK